jgi:hypothetical protein
MAEPDPEKTRTIAINQAKLEKLLKQRPPADSAILERVKLELQAQLQRAKAPIKK